MKSLKVLAAVLAMSVGVAAVAVHAEDGAAPKKHATSQKAPMVVGEITKIDGSTLTLSVKVKPAKEGDKATTEEKTVTLSDTVVVKIGDDTKTVGDLKVGDKVKVTLDAPDGKGIKVEEKAATTKPAGGDHKHKKDPAAGAN